MSSDDKIKITIKRRKTTLPVEEIKEYNVSLKTYHFNPSPQLVEHLMYFASVHKYDERKIFKEAWNNWIQKPEIAQLIQDEIIKLRQTGYTGNVHDKIFKSVRYYYKKKSPIMVDEEGVPLPPLCKQRKKYESLDKSILEIMDKHISVQIKTHLQPSSLFTKNICELSPAKAFEDFMICYGNDLEVEPEKIKKNYKNRLFRIRSALMAIPKNGAPVHHF